MGKLCIAEFVGNCCHDVRTCPLASVNDKQLGLLLKLLFQISLGALSMFCRQDGQIAVKFAQNYLQQNSCQLAYT